MGRKLVELWDPALEIPVMPEVDVVHSVTRHNRERLLTVLAVSEFKRRLAQASDAERARDKQTARAIGGALGNVLMLCERNERSWSTMWEEYREEARNNLAARQAAAVIRFSEWLPTTAAAIEREAVWCAGWVLSHNTASEHVRALVRQLDDCRARFVLLHKELR